MFNFTSKYGSDLPKLNEKEGYSNHYDRIKVEIQLDNGRKIEIIDMNNKGMKLYLRKRDEDG
ncbi:unnamed protein product [marine sediment metagenome]|uniref:Uncharacterized protein n=1 Tax=marine sediment metagenome TaxID=412755 RepID=X1ARV7_9ZZZZ